MNDNTTDAATLFAPLWKRKWLILAVAVVVGAGTYIYYRGQASVYVARTQLYLGGSSEAQSAASGSSSRTTLTGRALADQVELINSSIIGEPVRKRLKAEGDIAALRATRVKATASATADFIIITTEAHQPRAAIAIANDYAQAYVRRERTSYLRSIESQITDSREQLRRIEASGTKAKGAKGSVSNTTTIQAATLATRINELEASLTGSPGVQQIGTAKASPLPVSPTPKKSAIFGFVIGLLLASVAAYVLTRFDRRLRALADVERVYKGRILAALPTVKHPVRRPGGEFGPARSHLEPLRRLHTTLQLGDMLAQRGGGGPRTILFLSADAGDGRSTIVANLARVQREAGQRVAVIEADFRRPVLSRLLDVEGARGLEDVLSGRLTFREAVQSAGPITGAPSPEPAPDAAQTATGPLVPTLLESSGAGCLSVLTSGGAASNPPALLASAAMAELLRSAAEDYDFVLIDVPSLLEVSDAMPLLGLVDGMIIVARLGHTRENSAQRLTDLLASTTSPPLLGLVANCVPRRDIERYGFSWAPAPARRPNPLRR
jgi:Mrp family chromosome partitioning ATPase